MGRHGAGIAWVVSMFSLCTFARDPLPGPVVGWRDGSLGKTTPPGSVNGTAGTAIAIAVGHEHNLAIRSPEPSATTLGTVALGANALPARRHRMAAGPARSYRGRSEEGA